MRGLARISTVVLTTAILTACVSQAAPRPTPTETAIVLPPPAPTSTPYTPLPLAMTASPSATLTPEPSATPTPSFASLRLINFEKGNFGARMIFDLPGVTVPYDVLVGGLTYTCALVPERANRVVCLSDKLPAPDKKIPFVLMMPGTTKVVYQTELTLASGLYPALRREGSANTRPPWCGPIDYPSVHCEMECRVESDGPCLAASCWDACGYAFSVHSCHEDPPQPVCDAAQKAAQKALYGIP